MNCRTQVVFKVLLAAVLVASSLQALIAQDLAPRAYFITPIHSNAAILTYSFYHGDILFNQALPVTDATASINISVLSYYHTMNFFGRSSNFTASLPYGVGYFNGKFIDNETSLYRSGLVDSTYRFSVNLFGGPAMDVKDFRKWRQKSLLGASLKMVAPTGQYDPTKLINNGSNRWAFKPELAYSRRLDHWYIDAYGAGWFFTTNPEFWSHNSFYPGVRSQSQAPIGAFEVHLSYDVKPRLWISLDANTWFGGKTTVNITENALTHQLSSMIGATASVPFGRHQSLKFGVNSTDYVQYGGNYANVSVAWQYSWLGRPN